MGKLDVIAMVNTFSEAENEDLTPLFGNQSKPVTETMFSSTLTQKPVVPQTANKSEVTTGNQQTSKREWEPDKDLLEDMPEVGQSGAVYNSKDVIAEEDNTLHNIADDNAISDAREAMDELSRTALNIEDAKKRHGIKILNIPPGQFHASITAAAGDTNYKRAQESLDVLFDDIKAHHPDFITEWVDDKQHEQKNSEKNTGKSGSESMVHDETDAIPSESEDLKVVIDKRQLPEMSWTQEEMDKIKKSRSIELDIVEVQPIEYSQIEDAPENVIDALLAPYQYKVNSIDSPLPASKYRATFTGLPYPEVIDLSSAQEMDTIEGEMKKWSIAYNHMKNQSIGPWEEYQWYIDPATKKRVKISISAPIPAGLTDKDVHVVTKFEDFLMKTSFIDLDWMLWKILCATTKDKEIVSIDCGGMYNGDLCKKTYDWIYSPKDLLIKDNINPAVLEEMEKTLNVSSKEDIEANYMSSMLKTNNVAKFGSSGLKVVFGHISAYEYLTEIYPKLKEIEEMENDPSIPSRGVNVSALTVIRALLVPQIENGVPTGKEYKIEGVDKLLKIINNLDEVDWQTMTELVGLMLNPYKFRYALRDVVCPKCGQKSSITIESISRLLFIVARSLASVNVKLKRT